MIGSPRWFCSLSLPELLPVEGDNWFSFLVDRQVHELADLCAALTVHGMPNSESAGRLTPRQLRLAELAEVVAHHPAGVREKLDLIWIFLEGYALGKHPEEFRLRDCLGILPPVDPLANLCEGEDAAWARNALACIALQLMPLWWWVPCAPPGGVPDFFFGEAPFGVEVDDGLRLGGRYGVVVSVDAAQAALQQRMLIHNGYVVADARPHVRHCAPRGAGG